MHPQEIKISIKLNFFYDPWKYPYNLWKKTSLWGNQKSEYKRLETAPRDIEQTN